MKTQRVVWCTDEKPRGIDIDSMNVYGIEWNRMESYGNVMSRMDGMERREDNVFVSILCVLPALALAGKTGADSDSDSDSDNDMIA